MTRRTYTLRTMMQKKELCDECGANADWWLVADVGEPDTGYVDEVRICRACLKARFSNAARPEKTNNRN